MKQFIVDTNAILRFFLNDIPTQQKAIEKLFQRAKRSEITLLVPQIVVFELNFILDKYYRFNKEKIINTLKPLVSADYLEVESKEVFIPALTLYDNSTASFVDCFLLCRAKLEKAKLYTFDKKLKKTV